MGIIAAWPALRPALLATLEHAAAQEGLAGAARPENPEDAENADRTLSVRRAERYEVR